MKRKIIICEKPFIKKAGQNDAALSQDSASLTARLQQLIFGFDERRTWEYLL